MARLLYHEWATQITEFAPASMTYRSRSLNCENLRSVICLFTWRGNRSKLEPSCGGGDEIAVPAFCLLWGNNSVIVFDGHFASYVLGANGALSEQYVLLDTYVEGDAILL